MIPFRPTEERVWRAMRGLLASRQNPSDYAVHVDYAVMASLLGDNRSLDFGPARTIFGLPIKPDHTLRRGAVVLRHEVEA